MVLITGASGFVGQYLVRQLSALGQQVRALYLNHAPSQELKNLEGVEWMRCDLLDIFEVEAAMTGVDDIYHCAAIVSFDPAHREEMLHFNPESTANIINQALEQGIRKLVHLSSVAALGFGNQAKQIDENEDWSESIFHSAYGLSKHLAEIEVWRGIGEGLTAVIINPGIILGTGNWNRGSARIMKVVSGIFPFYTGGVSAWVDLSDVVRIMVLLMSSDIEAERFIVSAGNFSFRDVFTKMAVALHKKPPGLHASQSMSGIIWRASRLLAMMTRKESLLSRETVENAVRKSFYNSDKFSGKFPDFRYVAIEQTISEMAENFLKTNTLS